MYRKMLIITLMLGICVAGFSQPNEVNVNPKELAKTVVENSQKEFLVKMKRRLKDRNEPNVKFSRKMTEEQQFLYQENLIDSVLQAKSHNLKDVFKKLCDKSKMPTNLEYEGININNITYKIFETGKKQGQVDSTTLVVPVSFETHTVAKDGISNVKYAVTFKWEVKVKAQKEKVNVDGKKINQIVGYVQNGAPTLVSSVAKPISYLTTDKKNIKATAQKAITEWYLNLPQTLDKQYADQSISAIKGKNVSPNDIVFDLPESQNIVIKDVPTIKVEIDPFQFINEKDSSLYTDPVAYIIISPTFNVSVNDSFNEANLSVSYVVNDTIKPIVDKEKELRNNIANDIVAKFAELLSTYVSSRDAEQKTNIENMFATTDSDVEVSHLSKYGPEKIKKQSVKKYLSLLKGSSLDIHVEKIESDSNWDALIYIINQDFQSKSYSDYTQKKIYMTYDSTKGSYVITKIEVILNTTSRK